MSEYSREKIKLRMLRRIAMLWDISDIEYVDPVVRLLIEAMAEEIFVLAGEISNLDDRLLSKLSASMTPVTSLTARPAHAVLGVTPTEPAVTMGRNTFFEYKESRLLRKYNLESIRFTPVVPFELVKANIRFINVEDKLYKYNGECRKSFVGYAQEHGGSLNSCVCVGIEVSPEISSLKKLSFYFDFLNVGDKGQYLELLPYTQWSISGKSIACKQGISRPDTTTKNGYSKEQQDVILSDLLAIYDKHYVTLEEVGTNGMKNYPDDWSKHYPAEVLSHCVQPLLWIKITFPSSVPGDILEHLRIAINVFPVMNMSKRTAVRKMTDVSMYMPLDTGRNESFIEIESVKDSSGKVYDLLSPGDGRGEVKTRGTYSLRQGGVERYSDTNDAKSAILRLTDIIRDRNMFSSSKAEVEFQQMVNDILVSIDKISNAVNTLEPTAEPRSYILVDKANPGESLIVDYWVTNGDVINNFKPIVPLVPDYQYSAALEEKIHFLTPVQGGVAAPAIDKIKDIHRYMLTSHDRIFTKCDILNFCKTEYGQYIDAVEIKPGVAISKKLRQGLIKTIDVYMKVKETRMSEVGLAEENLKSELLWMLEKRSPEHFNYRIFITK